MKAWLRTALLGLGLGALPAVGEPDSFGRGTGRDGALLVRETGRVLNRYAQVSGPTAPGDSVLLVTDTDGFSPGDLVMVLQATGLVPEPVPGKARPIEFSRDAVGQWEFARVSASGEGTLTLTAPLVNAYAAGVTQVIRVPEYTRVHIREGAEVRAAPWNGRTGGVVAFLATGEVLNEGTLSATGAGFRGGAYVPDALEPALCLGLSLDARPGARKGESIAVTQYGPMATGREAMSHGGGGGLCPSAGGGGGGNGGPGGRGGAPVELTGELLTPGGEGGAKLEYSLADRLSFGGGGGSGQGEDELRPEGGAGGGAVLIRAHQLSGRGVIVADGAPGGAAGRGGAGGGGAGGSIHLRFDDSTACGGVSARGGAGGDASPYLLGAGVPGGGGGGGRILFPTASRVGCPLGIEAAPGGTASASMASGESWNGAQPTQGSLRLHSGILEGTLPAADVSPGDTNNPSTLADLKVVIPGVDTVVRATSGLYVQGTANPGNKVSVELNERLFAEELTTLDTGIWSKTFTKDAYNQDFEDHLRYKISVKVGTGNPTAPQSFMVDKVAPVASITSSQPVGNDGQTQSDSIRFVFTHNDLCPADWGNDPARPDYSSLCDSAGSLYKDVKFKCSMDGVVVTDCKSPQSHYNLSEGEHEFILRAGDSASPNDGYESAVVKIKWHRDITKPVVKIDQPPVPRTNSTNAEFKFRTTNESKPGVSFKCTLTSESKPDLTSSCSSPHTYASLSEGVHTFIVVADDLAGNSSAPVSATWTVDTVGPETRIAAKPPSSTRERSARFEFDSELNSTFECALDSGAFSRCESPSPHANLGNGDHTFFVRATDVLGNLGATATYSWKVDFSLPTTTIDVFPIKLTTSRDARFTFSSNKTNVNYECALTGRNGSAFAQCTSRGEEKYSGLADGPYTFSVRSVDALGNREEVAASYTWTVDTTPPVLVITKPEEGGQSSTPFVSVEGRSDTGIKVLAFFDNSQTPVQAIADDFNGSWQLKPSSALTEGPHELRVEVVDWADRREVRKIKFTVNTFRPETQITSGPPSPYKSGIARFVFSAPNVPEDRAGEVEFRCQLDEAPAETRCEQEQEYFKLKNGVHKLSVRAWLDGNEDLTASFHEWEVRIEAPQPPDIVAPINGEVMGVGRSILSGRAIPKGSVLVFINGERSGIALADSLGAWTFTPSPPLAPGNYTAEAEVEDELSNKSEKRSAPVSFTVETVSDISGYGEGGGGLSCSAGGALPSSLLLWGVLALLGAKHRRC